MRRTEATAGCRRLAWRLASRCVLLARAHAPACIHTKGAPLQVRRAVKQRDRIPPQNDECENCVCSYLCAPRPPRPRPLPPPFPPPAAPFRLYTAPCLLNPSPHAPHTPHTPHTPFDSAAHIHSTPSSSPTLPQHTHATPTHPTCPQHTARHTPNPHPIAQRPTTLNPARPATSHLPHVP